MSLAWPVDMLILMRSSLPISAGKKLSVFMRCVQGIVLRPSGTSVYVDSSAIYGDVAFHIKTRILML